MWVTEWLSIHDITELQQTQHWLDSAMCLALANRMLANEWPVEA